MTGLHCFSLLLYFFLCSYRQNCRTILLVLNTDILSIWSDKYCSVHRNNHIKNNPTTTTKWNYLNFFNHTLECYLLDQCCMYKNHCCLSCPLHYYKSRVQNCIDNLRLKHYFKLGNEQNFKKVFFFLWNIMMLIKLIRNISDAALFLGH